MSIEGRTARHKTRIRALKSRTKGSLGLHPLWKMKVPQHGTCKSLKLIWMVSFKNILFGIMDNRMP